MDEEDAMLYADDGGTMLYTDGSRMMYVTFRRWNEQPRPTGVWGEQAAPAGSWTEQETPT